MNLVTFYSYLFRIRSRDSFLLDLVPFNTSVLFPPTQHSSSHLLKLSRMARPVRQAHAYNSDPSLQQVESDSRTWNLIPYYLDIVMY